MTFQGTAIRIADALASASGGDFARLREEASNGNEASWYTKMISRLALLVADDEIAYATGALSVTGEPDARIVLFTEHRVITATVKLHGGEPAEYEPMVTTYARKSVIAIEAVRVANVFSGAESPGAFQVRVSYENDKSVTIPAGTSTTAIARLLVEFLPSLLSDLNP